MLALLARWVGNAGPGMAARLGPPVVETVQRGQVVDRRVADFGLSWPLPAPDGL